MQVLGLDVSASQVALWRTWLAPRMQPFFLAVTEASEFNVLPAAEVMAKVTAEQRDTLQLWKIESGLSAVWLEEQTFSSLPRATRARLVRAQVRHGRGGVPTVRGWSDLLDPHILRTQADGHRFVWWPSLVTDEVVESVLARVVIAGADGLERDRLSSRHAEVDESIWQNCADTLPGARRLAGTFPPGSGANCFGTAMAISGVPGMDATWMLQAPFEDWLRRSTRRGGRDTDPGTILVWRDDAGAARHAAVTIGGGWGIEKPSQDWHSPRAVLAVSDIIRDRKERGQHLLRYTLAG